MYGGENGLNNTDATNVTAPIANPQDQRKRYSRDELLRLRALSRPSPAHVENLRLDLGPIAKSSDTRAIPIAAHNGRFMPRDSRSAPTSLASSPPSRFEDRFNLGDPRARTAVEDSTNDPSRSDTEPVQTSGAARDLARVFQTPPDSFLAAVVSRSPPPNGNDHGMPIPKSDGEGSIASMSPEQKPKYDLASSPRDGMMYGFGEYRRRSPSPRPSPKGSPKLSASPSCPPGFGPPVHQKNGNSQAPRNLNNYKVRIAKGPNMAENFATRIAYRKRQAALQGSAKEDSKSQDIASKSQDIASKSHDIASDVAEKRELINVFLRASERVDDVSKSLAKLEASNGAGPALEMKRPPPMNYSISSDVSFSDFSKRLAAEMGNGGILENKETTFESDIIASLEDAAAQAILERDTTGPVAGEGRNDELHGLASSLESKESAVGQNGKVTSTADQEAMDELSKWFSRIAAASPENEEDQEDIPKSNVEEPKAETTFHNETATKEELDSGVLSFFDTIRSQALTEGNCAVLENSSPIDADEDSAPQLRIGASDSKDTDRTQADGLDGYETTEVEQFFQLFTEGKPVYSSEQTQSSTVEDSVNMKRGETYVQNGMDGKTQGAAQNEPDSDSLGLERWFAALASRKHAQ